MEIAKIQADGHESTRYLGRVLDATAHSDWIVIAAEWTRGPIDLDGLHFLPGDHLREYFSPTHWFNVFEVIAPEGVTRGWYANVTYPSWMESVRDVTTVYWHDLFVDLVVLPDGTMTIRDEDELEEANLTADILRQIMAGRDAVMNLARRRAYPFEHDRS